MESYFKTNLITYMGNKRKLVFELRTIFENLIQKLNKSQSENVVCGDAFSGSGVISRVLKTISDELYVNDNASYVETLNSCFLASPTKQCREKIEKEIKNANAYAHQGTDNAPYFIRNHWAPHDENNIQPTERAYFTKQNATLIDKYMFYILNYCPPSYRNYLKAMLLVESSIHNNTNGQFSAFYKDENGIPKYGGKKEIDIKRITRPIVLKMPEFYNNKCKTHIAKQDANNWVKTIPEVDIMYLDPPYNKHPYCIYYFLLSIINNWNTAETIPDTYRGQPKNWKTSDYNSSHKAYECFSQLVKSIKAKYIVLSYNNKGILSKEQIMKILSKKGKVTIEYLNHKTYNKLEGIANYKREKTKTETKEFVFIVEVKTNKATTTKN